MLCDGGCIGVVVSVRWVGVVSGVTGTLGSVGFMIGAGGGDTLVGAAAGEAGGLFLSD